MSENVTEEQGTEREAQGPEETVDTTKQDDLIASLQSQRDAALAEKESVKAESIQRRHKLKDYKEENAGLLERIEALEAANRTTSLEAARSKAIAEHGLPADAVALLGDDPDAVASKAEALAGLLSPKKTPAKSEDSEESAPKEQHGIERKPSGGRNPNAGSEIDMNSLIAQWS